jgi:hypothetical protein
MILQGQAACSIDKTVEGEVSEPNAGSSQDQYYRGKLPCLSICQLLVMQATHSECMNDPRIDEVIRSSWQVKEWNKRHRIKYI